MEVFDEYFKMDTIAKAENVAMALGLSLFCNMNKDFNPLCLEKRNYEVLNTFKVTLCSSC
jgi:hypothetical protein